MVIKEKFVVYQKNYDMTFIMVDTWEDDNLISTECVGWYHGEESKESTEYFTGKLKATYGLE